MTLNSRTLNISKHKWQYTKSNKTLENAEKVAAKPAGMAGTTERREPEGVSAGSSRDVVTKPNTYN